MKKMLTLISAVLLCVSTLSHGVILGQDNSGRPTQPRAASGSAQQPKGKFNRVSNPVLEQYIVVLDEAALDRDVPAAAADLASAFGGHLKFVYEHALKGFSIRMPEAAAIALSRHPLVKYVEEDAQGSLDQSFQSSPPWHLDRIDERSIAGGSNGVYWMESGGGENVDIYILDSGVRVTHNEFYPSRATHDADFIGDGQNGNDCNGHGTHVAALAAGKIYGVAKFARIHNVRVANCVGDITASTTIAGFDFVVSHQPPQAQTQGYIDKVVNLSATLAPSFSLDASVRNAISSGITVVVSAGNSNADVANYSPSRVHEAVTVGASTITDSRASFSNYGAYVDLFAPGDNITSAGIASDTATALKSGTSMASPLVAGAIARWKSIQSPPYAFGPPSWMPAAEIRRNSSPRLLANVPSGTPNRLLFTRFNYFARNASGGNYLYRYYQPQVGDHFYTINFNTLGTGASGYILEWVEAFVSLPNDNAAGLTPLYRYYHPNITDHFYTTNFATLGGGGMGWTYEGIECKVFAQPQSNTVPLLRYYNAQIGDHFYTINFDELGNGANGYVAEGNEGWVLP